MSERPQFDEVVIPLAEETAAITKHARETGRVQVSLNTEIETVIAREVLRGRKIEFERVPINLALAEGEPAPQSQVRGDTLVIPVVEEVAVVVKRLVVRKELRLTFVTTETPFEEEVVVRRQVATVDALPPSGQTATRRDS